jgi:arylformamidase
MGVVDLSVSLTPAIGVPPALKDNRMTTEAVIRRSTESAEMVRVGFLRNLCIHTGTHVDAPCHALEGRADIGSIPLDRLVGSATVLDLGEVAADTPVGPERLEKFSGDIRPEDIVILYSHWSERMWTRDEYWTTSPFLTVDGARWLVARHPKAVVFDFFEEYDARFPDFDALGFKAHREILGHDVLIVEHVINLRALPQRCRFVAAPLKLDGMEGSPVRALAILD